jgi:cysteine desulfurase
MRSIYLDYNATTPIAPAVQEAMLPYLAEHYGNPSSGHPAGRAAREAVEDARYRVATLLGASPDEIVFTSGGTESNNLAIKGLVFRRGARPGHVVMSAIEHPAVVEPVRFLERLGHAVTVVGCNPYGVVSPLDIKDALRADTFLVSVMHANNEIGSVQPITEIAALCRQRGIPCHTDAAQSAGKIPVQVRELGVDLLSLAGHKMYAPKGVGALYVRRGIELEPLLHGAGHERGLRAGTENVPYIVGLGRAASLALSHLTSIMVRLAELRDRLQQKLLDGIGCDAQVHGPPDDGTGWRRLPNTLSISFPGVSGHELLRRAVGICASTGSACHSGATCISATLAAMGVNEPTARGTVRLSVGWYTDEAEVDRAADMLLDAWDSLRTVEPNSA